MIEKSTPKTSSIVISLSIDAELLRRLDVRAAIEGRTRSNMVARMIDFYLYPKVELSTMYGYVDTDSAHTDMKER